MGQGKARQARIKPQRHGHAIGQRHGPSLGGRQDLAFQIIQHLLTFGQAVADTHQTLGCGDCVKGEGRLGHVSLHGLRGENAA